MSPRSLKNLLSSPQNEKKIITHWLPWWFRGRESSYNQEPQETKVQSLGWEDPLEESMTP